MLNIISKRTLRAFWVIHPDARTLLLAWHMVVEHAEWKTFADVRATYPSADQVGRFTVFNIGGNKYRLIAVIHFNRAKVYVRHVLTHAEYDRGAWKDG
jgi:mRNA interferase HigB